MSKKLFSDHNSQYSHISSIIYNAPGGKKLAIKPAFHKQTIQNPLVNHLGNKVQISSIPSVTSVFGKKVNENANVGYEFGSKSSQIIFIRKVFFAVLLQLVVAVSLQVLNRVQQDG